MHQDDSPVAIIGYSAPFALCLRLPRCILLLGSLGCLLEMVSSPGEVSGSLSSILFTALDCIANQASRRREDTEEVA